MSVTDLGISIEERFPQFIKAFAPIVTSVSGKVTFVRPSQPLKALSPISVTPDGITTVVNAAFKTSFIFRNGFSDNTFISVLPIKFTTHIFLPLQSKIPYPCPGTFGA